MIAVEKQGEIAILRMQYGAANALDVAFCAGLTKTLREQAAASRAIVLTGQGKIFSAGVDLPQLLEGGIDYIRKFLPALDELLETLFFCPQPVVAAINGHAIAGGCLLACAADRRLMTPGKGRIGVPELRVGVPFPTVVMEIMRARTAPSHYEEITLGGATYPAEEALQRGLVDGVIEDEALLGEAISAAESLAALRPELFSLSKQQTRQPVRAAIEAHRPVFEARIRAMWESPATLEAIRGFVARTLKK